MTEQQHLNTPPPELVEDWIELAKPLPQRPPNPGELATLAARWGSDQELEACCDFLQELLVPSEWITGLRTARRPKPPSLKEQALEALDEEHADIRIQNYKLIRSVLESLPD
jgi:hypothetical protein